MAAGGTDKPRVAAPFVSRGDKLENVREEPIVVIVVGHARTCERNNTYDLDLLAIEEPIVVGQVHCPARFQSLLLQRVSPSV